MNAKKLLGHVLVGFLSLWVLGAGSLLAQDPELLIQRIRSKDASLHATSSQQLGEIGERAIPLIIRTLENKKEIPETRIWLLEALKPNAKYLGSFVRNLAKLLRDKDVDVRGNSLEILGRMGSKARPVIDKVLETWNDPDNRIRRLAFFVTQQIAEDFSEYLPRLINILSDSDPIVREGAALALATLKEKALPSLPQLILLYKDPSEAVRAAAAKAIGSMGKAAVKEVMALLEEGKPRELKLMAIKALGRLRPVQREQAAALVALATGPDQGLRAAAQQECVRVGQPCTRGMLKALEKHRDNQALLIEILSTLGIMGHGAKEAVSAIKSYLAPSVPRSLRLVATKSLGLLGKDAKKAAPAVVKILDEKDPKLVQAAMRTLVRMRVVPSDGLSKIMGILKGENPLLRTEAAMAIKQLGPLALNKIEALIDLLGSKDANLRLWASFAIGGMGRSANGPLRRAFKAASKLQKIGILQTFGELGIGAASSVEFLTKVLHSEDPPQMIHAGRALARIGHLAAPAIPTLLKLLRKKDKDVRVVALTALGKISTKNEALRRAFEVALKDPQPEVVYSSLEAMGKIRDPRWTPKLLSLLHHKDEHVRWRAVEALGLIHKGTGRKDKKILKALKALEKDPSKYVVFAGDLAIRRILGLTTR
jgi:HEAT repeat protein